MTQTNNFEDLNGHFASLGPDDKAVQVQGPMMDFTLHKIAIKLNNYNNNI